MGMGIVYDIVIVLMIVAVTSAAMKKGFAYTLVNFAGYIVSLFAAVIVSRPLTDTICSKLIEPSLYARLADTVGKAGNDIAAGINEFTNSLPAIAKNIFPLDSVSLSGGTESVIDTVSQSVIMPVVENIIYAISFIVVFSLLLFLVRRVADITKFVKYVPLVGFVNRILGGAMGVVKGLIIAYLLFCAVNIASVWFGDSVAILSKEVLDSSYIFKLMDSIRLR